MAQCQSQMNHTVTCDEIAVTPSPVNLHLTLIHRHHLNGVIVSHFRWLVYTFEKETAGWTRNFDEYRSQYRRGRRKIK